MMKKLFLFFSIFLGSLFVQAKVLEDEPFVILQVGLEDPTSILGGKPRTPINPPSASIDGHTFYINGEHSGYTFYLIDNSGDEPDVVYQVIIPAGVNAVVLPATLSGTYELQLHNGGAFYFYAEIEL